jgi:hypothetical protein
MFLKRKISLSPTSSFYTIKLRKKDYLELVIKSSPKSKCHQKMVPDQDYIFSKEGRIGKVQKEFTV